MAFPSERRRTRRYRCYGPIDFRIRGWSLRKGKILNLCLNGCLIQPRLATDCVAGDVLDLRFEVKQMSFRAQCVVRSVHPSGALGVEILDLSERNRLQLGVLLAELEASIPAEEEKA